jgi:hypothetical protein
VALYSVEGLLDFTFLDELTLKENEESSSARELLAVWRTLQFMAESDSFDCPSDHIKL